MIFLGIDPSVNNVGIALYNSDLKKLRTETFHPSRNRETPVVNVAMQVARHIHITFLQREKRPNYMVLEMPQWEDSVRGHKAAAQGYTLDLAFIVGYLSGSLGLASAKIHTPTPMEWKGNMPKTAVGARFEKRFGVLASSVEDHEFEAAMMIDWLIKSVLPKEGRR